MDVITIIFGIIGIIGSGITIQQSWSARNSVKGIKKIQKMLLENLKIKERRAMHSKISKLSNIFVKYSSQNTQGVDTNKDKEEILRIIFEINDNQLLFPEIDIQEFIKKISQDVESILDPIISKNLFSLCSQLSSKIKFMINQTEVGFYQIEESIQESISTIS